MQPFQQSAETLLAHLKSNSQTGLSQQAAEQRLKQQGLNQLQQGQKTSLIALFFKQFNNPLLYILILGAILSFSIGHLTDGIAISVIVLINALISFTQERSAQKSLDALKEMASPQAQVLREGEWQTIAANQLVTGDIVQIRTGSIVPADLRLLDITQLQIDESALTGESDPVHKSVEAIEADSCVLAEQRNMAFMSTSVTLGQGIGLVVATAMQTQVGHIAHLMNQTGQELTPLQQRIHRLSHNLLGAALLIVLTVLGIGLMQGMALTTMIETGISLAVAAIPEGLPTIVTIVLTMGARQMMRHNALAKHLTSVETLGSTSVICSDKTGTLTQNKMVVQTLWVDGQFIDVTGQGYQPIGEFSQNSQPLNPQANRHLQKLLTYSALCSDTHLIERNGQYQIHGLPTEGAIIVAAAKAGIDYRKLPQTLLNTAPFDSKRKMMSVIIEDENQEHWLVVKGAPDILLQRTEAIAYGHHLKDFVSHQNEIEAVIETFAQQALRTLAIGYRKLKPHEIDLPPESLEDNLTLIGIHGIMDPPRPEAIHAIQECHAAGVKVVMITGDHAITAQAIAQKMHLLPKDYESNRVMTGPELNQITDDELNQRIDEVRVFARVTPEHKLRIVQALQSKQQVVAMTGDGVNDAPALRKADIGVAMGITGTGVAKESADLILLDDNFATIVTAVKEGRRIYDNFLKFIRQDLTTNVSEVSAILFAFILLTGDNLLTLAPLMILWINLVSDGLPSLALGVDGAERDVMSRQPRSRTESFFANHLGQKILIRGLALGGISFAMFNYALGQGMALEYAQTLAFMTLVFGQLVHVFDARSFVSIYQRNPFSNKPLLWAVAAAGGASLLMVYTPFGHLALGTESLSSQHLIMAFAIGALPTLILSAIRDLFKLPWL